MGDTTVDQTVSRAQDSLMENPVQPWVKAIAYLDKREYMDVPESLKRCLFEERILPDSLPWREVIKAAVLREAEKLSKHADDPSVDKTRERIERLLNLSPSYTFNDLAIPIVEYPYPACAVQSVEELKKYVLKHINEILKLDVDSSKKSEMDGPQ
jgi:hypothetical protein